jgi:hypothetical protein
MSSSSSAPPSSPPTPPSGGARILRDALAALEAIPELKSDYFGGVAAADIALSDPLPTYTLSLKAVGGGALPAAADLTQWRYLLSATRPAQPLATADLGLLDGKWQLAGINSGPVAAATADAVAFVLTTPEWKTGAFELRLLQVPALLTVLGWLRAMGEGAGEPIGDRFVAIADPEQALKPRTLLDEATVLHTLQDLAANYQVVPA